MKTIQEVKSQAQQYNLYNRQILQRYSDEELDEIWNGVRSVVDAIGGQLGGFKVKPQPSVRILSA